MILQDAFGCDVTMAQGGAPAAWDRMMRGFLAHSAETPVHLGAVLAADPGMVIAQACRGLFSLMLGRRELHAPARQALTLTGASAAARGATRRERLYVAALAFWLDGRPSLAAAAMEQVLSSWPQDALAMKISQTTRFMLGDQEGMRRSVERLLPAWAGITQRAAICMGATPSPGGGRRIRPAEAQGRLGLDLAPDDAWGLHAVAHVYDMTGRTGEGIAFLGANRRGWAHCNNFRYHVWWHLALMHLDRGETDRALGLYDAEVRGDRTDDYRDIANASSLLMRLELDGVCVGAR